MTDRSRHVVITMDGHIIFDSDTCKDIEMSCNVKDSLRKSTPGYLAATNTALQGSLSFKCEYAPEYAGLGVTGAVIREVDHNV